MAKGLNDRILMENMDAQDQSVFTSHAWRRLFEVRGPLLGGAKRRMSWREFILAVGLHTAEEIGPTRFRTCWAESSRQIPDKGDQSVYWRGISLIACIIAGRIQAPEKVTVTDLFYLMGMDVNSFNIPYLLA
ncbi:hypothetical protein Tco_1511355, partial [Tanacetum coccineum]